MSKCEITVVKGIPVGKSYPKLMNALYEKYEYNADKAIKMYGLALSKEYKDIAENPNSIESFDKYLQYKNIISKKKLSDVEKVFMNRLLNQESYIENFKQVFIDAFTNENGVFQYNNLKLKDSGIKIENIENNLKIIENIYYYLNNTSDEFEVYTSPKVDGESINLDSNLFSLKVDYADLTTSEKILERAVELEDTYVLNNEHVQKWILDYNLENTLIPSIEVTNDGEVISVTNSFKNRLIQSFDAGLNYNNILSTLDYLVDNLYDIIRHEKQETVEEFFKSIENSLIKKGLPVKNLSKNLIDKPIGQVENYLTSLYNFIYDVTNISDTIEESVNDFSTQHDLLFEQNPEEILREVKRQNGDLVKVNTSLSDAKMLSQFNLLHKGDKTYKIYSVDILDLANSYDDSMRSDLMDLYEEGDDIVEVKALVVANALDGKSNSEVLVDSRYTRPSDLDVDKFLIDFNKVLIKNSFLDEVFAFTQNGLEARGQISDFNKNMLSNFLDRDMFMRLQDYAMVSGNESLKELLPEFSEINSKNDDILRNFYLNNPKKLLPLLSDYKKKDNVVVADGVNGNFVRVEGNIYERVDSNTFVKLEKNSSFNIFNAKKPEYKSVIEDSPSIKKDVEVSTSKLKIEIC